MQSQLARNKRKTTINSAGAKAITIQMAVTITISAKATKKQKNIFQPNASTFSAFSTFCHNK